MPVFQVDIEKQLGLEFWTNVYYVRGVDLAEAVTAGQVLANMEVQIHKPAVTITRFRTRTTTVGDEVYNTTTVGLIGEASAAGDYLPLFNTYNAVLSTPQGRPSRKYYRLPVSEGEQASGLWIQGAAVNIAVSIDAARIQLQSAGTPWVDLDDQPILIVGYDRSVGMRQLRRGSRRRSTPVLP